MQWIAEYCRYRGHKVSGSDSALGGHAAENVDGADLVIYTSAISENNVELIAAKEKGIPVLSRAEALGKIGKEFTSLIAVAGTHGKTTVTGMLSSVLKNYDPALHIGGTLKGKCGKVNGDILIAEACEYRRNFLYLEPDISIILNIELDHTDFYKTYSSLLSSFARFASRSKTAVVPDSFAAILRAKRNGRQVTVGPHGDFALIDFMPDKTGSDICIKTPSCIFRARLNVIGKHNAQNAVYAVAAAMEYGAQEDEIREGLASFEGVDRRLQTVGKIKGVPVISDYAHHPTEIRASLDALRLSGYSRPLVVFQPHTYERLESLMRDSIYALLGVNSIILPVFHARGRAGNLTSWDLAHAITLRTGDSVAADFSRAAELITSNASRYDCIVIMGAGDNEKLIPLICDPFPKA